jgi:hypothetical protein
MRSFQSILFLLLGVLLSLAVAESATYETTVYLTNTVTQVYTITKSGAHPTGVAVNSTSIIPPSYGTSVPYPSGNATATPTGTTTSSPSAVFTGAASQFNVNAFVAVLAAGVGYLAL